MLKGTEVGNDVCEHRWQQPVLENVAGRTVWTMLNTFCCLFDKHMDDLIFVHD